MIRVPLAIAADHPAFAGHFPTRPIVPGVVLLDASLRAIDAACIGDGPHAWRIASAKFLSFVEPGEAVHLEYDRATPAGPFRVRVLAGHPHERLAARCSASMVPTEAAT